ncbi:MAG: nicotinate phosphoribosyltransferase [Thermoprotei archaeon]|nr:MAG: nicotinate phosphoribosyltransferase [Thermoprotei archaeon]
MTKRFLYATFDELKNAETTDVYFIRTKKILKEKGLYDTRVYMEVTVSSFPDNYKWAVYAGLREVVKLFEGLEGVNLYSIPEGTVLKSRDYYGYRIPVMVVEGPYGVFVEYETPLLGFLASASGIATKAARVKKAAGDSIVLSFGARRQHPALAPFVEYYAYIGGADGVSAVKGAELLGIEATGTMPHSLLIIFRAVKGDHTQAWLAFDEVVDPKVKRIALVDTFLDETEEALRAAKLLGERLWGVRLDTPSSRRGDFAEIIREVKWKLKAAGFSNVKIVVSGGINEYSIPKLKRAGAEAFGVGSAIAAAPLIDYAMDITAVEVGGKWVPIAKRGKLSGRKMPYRCEKCLVDVVKLESEEPPKCPICGGEMKPLLEKYLENGKVVKEPESPKEVKNRVKSQVEKIPMEDFVT